MYAVYTCVKYAYKKVKAKKHSVSMFVYWGGMVCKKERERSMISRVVYIAMVVHVLISGMGCVS